MAGTTTLTRRSRRWHLRYSTAIALFVADLEAARKSPATIHGYRSDLLKFGKVLRRDTVHDITPDVIREAMRLWSSYDLAQNTLFRRQTAIRAFCKWGRKQQRFWMENPTDLVTAIPQAARLPRPFEREEAERIWTLELPAVEDLGRALLFFTGLRVTSICTLSVGSVSGDMRQLRAVGKKGREQVVEAHPILSDKLAAHLITRPGARPYEPLLCYASGRRLTRRTIEKWTQRWGGLAGVVPCVPHRFRHAFGTALLEATNNLRTVQEAMGHASINSTIIYTKIKSTAVRDAILKLPWGRPPEEAG
jgi:integrase/recombinase XerC